MQSRWCLADAFISMTMHRRLLCLSVQQSCKCFDVMIVTPLLSMFIKYVWSLSATDVLVHMLMKGAAKCNNHCELQNSVNQLTIERRSAFGAFLRACLCQCFHIFSADYFLLEHECATSLVACGIKNCGCIAWSLLLALLCTLQLGKSAWTWHQAKQPAEFKHISKWRSWNQMGILK